MDIEFSDMISIFALILTVISFLIAYYIFKKQENWKEKNSLTDLFKQFKNDIETFYVSHLLPLGDIPLSSFIGNIPFYKTQQEKLIKLGIIVLNSKNDDAKNQIPVSLRQRISYSFLMVILNKYYIGVYYDQEHQMNIEIETIKKQKTFDTIEEVEEMLKKIIEYTKDYFNIKLNEEIIALSKYKNIWEESEKNESKREANK